MSHAWMPLYVADYLADTTHLSTVEHGAYMLLIMSYWQRGCLPDDDTKLARICRMSPDEWQGIRECIAELFGPNWTHTRIDVELTKAQDIIDKRSAAGKAAASARHNKRNATEPSNAVQTHTPSPSPSPSPSKNLAPNGACRPAEPTDAQTAFEIYNQTAKELGWPVAQAIKPRLSKINARLRECGGVEGWQAAMAKARASPFLSGSDGRSDGHENWRPDLDFFLQAKSFTKLMEGSYDATNTPNKREGGHDRVLRSIAKAYEKRLAERGGSVGSQPGIDDGGTEPPDQSGRILELAALRAGER